MQVPLTPSQLTRISREMALRLRHRPPQEIDAAGFVPLTVLLRDLRSPGTSEAAIRHIVATDAKGRYQLDDTSNPPRIRAVQGHTVPLAAPELLAVQSPDAVPLAIHVTSEDSWHAIQSCRELRRMSRTHIHFATAPSLLRRNSWATVILKLNLRQAMQDGYAFFLAANGVLLCEGPLPMQYVERISRHMLPQGWG